jgi:hypothetical protein
MVVAYRDERTWLNLLRLLVGGHHLIFWMIAFALEAARLFGPTVTQLLSSLVVHVSVFERWNCLAIPPHSMTRNFTVVELLTRTCRVHLKQFFEFR